MVAGISLRNASPAAILIAGSHQWSVGTSLTTLSAAAASAGTTLLYDGVRPSVAEGWALSDIWKFWFGDRTVEEFLEEVDAAVAEHLFPERRAAFVDYAECALGQLALAPGEGARKLADQLLAHALDVEGRAKQPA